MYFNKQSEKVKVTQLCPTLCESMDYSLPCSSVHGISQVRTLEWVAIFFSGSLSDPGPNLRFLHLLHWQTGSSP